jgi:hypothetical protein
MHRIFNANRRQTHRFTSKLASFIIAFKWAENILDASTLDMVFGPGKLNRRLPWLQGVN